MNACLLIMQPREIPECVNSLRQLRIPKAWFRGFTESELEPVITEFVAEHTEFTHFVIVCDDGIVTQGALDAVLDRAPYRPVVSGYCNLDLADNMQLVNLRKPPLAAYGETNTSTLYRLTEVFGNDEVPTSFVGFSLTCMTRDLWQRFPFQAMGGPPGNSSDWALSSRLWNAGVPMVGAGGAFQLHVKERWNAADTNWAKRLVHVQNGVRQVEYQP